MPASLPSATTRLALAVVALAGFTDAVSFQQFGHIYASFMSGNTTALGVALAGGGWAQAALLAGVVGLFVAGVVLGGWLHRAGGNPAGRVLGVVAGLLSLAAGWWPGRWALLALVLGMGMLNAAISQAGASPLSLTYVTGTLVKVGAGLLDRLSGRPWPAGWRRQVLDWLALAAGATLGALSWDHLGLRALLGAAAWAAALALLARRVPGA